MNELIESLNSEEKTIERGMQTFIEVGEALARIRDGKLWKAGEYASFDDYCKQRWNWDARYVRQVCQSSQIAKTITSKNRPGASAKGQNGTMVPPTRERQVRPLAKLPKDQQADAWQEAAEESKAEGKPITAAKVDEVVQRRVERVQASVVPPTPSPKRIKPGAEIISPKKRLDARKAYGVLVRFFDDLARAQKSNVGQRFAEAVRPFHGEIEAK